MSSRPARVTERGERTASTSSKGWNHGAKGRACFSGALLKSEDVGCRDGRYVLMNSKEQQGHEGTGMSTHSSMFGETQRKLQQEH